jgi:hypothetical protein
MKHTTPEQKKQRIQTRAVLFAEVCKALQSKYGYTTFAQVSAKIGVDRAVISNTIAAAKGGIDLDRICEICQAHGLGFTLEKSGAWKVG